MEFRNLKAAVREITMPMEMKHRIAENCKNRLSNAMEEYTVTNRKNHSVFRKPVAVFAALAVSMSLCVSVLAATGALQGFFRDMPGFTGAIVGTSYEQATGEIAVTATANGNALNVLVTFTEPDKLPYRTAEFLSIAEYKILDADGKAIQEGGLATSSPVVNGQSTMVIDLNDIGSGSYKLIVTAFVSEKKADQPLRISGTWECAFRK